MKKLYALVLFVCSCMVLAAQTPHLQWQKAYGSSATDYAYAMCATADGGYAMLGSTFAADGDVSGIHGSSDFWLVKTDGAGALQWQKCLGGGAVDNGDAIAQTEDHGYIVTGTTQSVGGMVTVNHGEFDVWVVKLDSLGSLEWEKSLGGAFNDYGRSILPTSDGGYVLVGESNSSDQQVSGSHGSYDAWVVKLDSFGGIEWQKPLGGSSYEAGCTIIQTTDGGYLIGGDAASNDGDVSGNHGLWDFWMAKLTSTGSLVWQKSYGGTGYEIMKMARATLDGGYIAIGRTESTDGDVIGHHGGVKDVWVVKVDSAGSIQWTKCYGGSDEDEGYDIQPMADGGYVLIGSGKSSDGDASNNLGNQDFWMLKIDSTGTVEWEHGYGGSEDEVGYCIVETSDQGFVAAGFSRSDDGDVTNSHGPLGDMWMVKVSTAVVGVAAFSELESVRVYPNPVQGRLHVEGIPVGSVVAVHNVVGEVILRSTARGCALELEMAGQPRGIYFLVVEQKGHRVTRTLVVD